MAGARRRGTRTAYRVFRGFVGATPDAYDSTPMAKKSFECTIVTPTAALVSGQVTYANVPAWDGQMGFQPGRAPILARLGKGDVRLDFADTKLGKGGTATYAVDGGFLQMADDKLVILAEKASSKD